MALNGKGAEGLAKHLNSYFSQMVRLIASDGGDVFKFAGDAMIVLWPESQSGDMETTVRRAAQCAYAIQENLDQSLMEEGVQLSVKIGIGFGRVSVLHVGGVFGRVEYLAVGEPLIQAFSAEHKSVSGQVVCSKEVWKIISEYVTADHIFPDGYARFDMDGRNKIKLVRKTSKMNTLRNNMSDTDRMLESRIKSYVAGAVLPNLNRDSPEDEQWGNELRRCCVLFVNLGLKEQHLLAAAVYDEAMVQVHEVLMAVQKSVYQYEGSINKFLMDDKGSTLIACFGLPPVSHDDDPTRAVLASLLLCEGLYDLGLIASVGITTGDVFCGVVGGKTRREYTVLGDSVNLSARLMQKANADGGGVLCDWETKNSCNGTLNFMTLDEIKVKGKTMPVKVFRPYPMDACTTITGVKGPNIYHDIHMQQLQNAVVHRSLLSLQGMFTPTRPSHIIQSNSQSMHSPGSSLGGAERVSYAPRRQSNAMMDHMRLSAPLARPRKSILRASIAHNSGSEVLPGGEVSDAARRGSTTSFKLPVGSGATRKDMSPVQKLTSFRSLNRISGTSVEIHVLVPHNLAMDFTEAFTIRPIIASEVSDFVSLRRKVIEVATVAKALSTPVTENEIALNVSGTRFFLPDVPIKMKWLSVFYHDAKSALNDPWKFGDPIELIVCRKSELRKVQSRLALAFRTLLQAKIALVESRKSSTIIIEGEAGVGKTHMIGRFIKNTIPNTAPVYYAPASPYSLEAYGPFSMIIQQYLDSKALRGHNGCSTRTEVLRDMLQRGSYKLLCDGPLLDRALGTSLGEVLLKECRNDGDKYEDIAEEARTLLDDLSASQKTCRRLQLYYYLLYNISCEQEVIVVIDDAHRVDDESWVLILMLTLAGVRSKADTQKILGDAQLPDIGLGSPSIMLIVSLRPIAKHRSLFRGPYSVYEALAGSPGVTFLKLDGLPPEETEDLLLSKLGGNVTSISEQIITLVDQKCMGNPWMIIQLVETLQAAQPPVLVFTTLSGVDGSSLPTLNEDGSFSAGSLVSAARRGSIMTTTSSTSGVTEGGTGALNEVYVSLTEDFGLASCPLPVAIDKSYGSLLDRLSSCQQMILKTAAHIGKQFSWKSLYHCYPLSGHKYRLQREMHGLLVLGYLVEVPNLQKVVDYSQNYHFVSDFLFSLVTHRMLTEQKEKISTLVMKHKSDIEARQRKIFAEKVMPVSGMGPAFLKAGMLDIQKKVTTNFLTKNIKRRIQGGDWKQRYCVVTASTSNTPGNISLYRDKHHYSTSPATPTQVIFLRGSFVQIEPSYVQHEKEFVFRIDAQQYLKDKSCQDENRSFLFAGASEADITDWVYMIKYANELSGECDMDTEETIDIVDPASLAKTTNSNAGKSDVELHVTILSARNIICPDVYGSGNCYVKGLVDGESMRSHLSFDSTEEIFFKHKFEFPLSQRQWLCSKLTISINSMDIFLTDDLIGYIDLAISDVRIVENASDCTADDSVEGTWYPLETRTRNDHSLDESQQPQCGEICVVLEAVLSPHLKESLLASDGSLDKMKSRIRTELKEEDELKSMNPVPAPAGRIGTIEDLIFLLKLADSPDSDISDDDSDNVGPGPNRYVARRMNSRSRHGGDTAAQSVQVKQAGSKLQSILRNVNNYSGEVVATAESGSVNKMWICRQLREVISDLGVSPENATTDDDMRNPFKHVLEQASTLDQQHLDWLASQYTRESTPTETAERNLILTREKSVNLKARRASVVQLQAGSPTSDMSFKRLSVSVWGENEPPVLSLAVAESGGYYCKDKEGVPQGPFTAHQIYDWMVSHQLHGQALVHHGDSEDGEYFPLAMFERSLRRIMTSTIEEWPSVAREGGHIPMSIGIFRDNNHPIRNCYSWDFDVWDLEPHELLPLSMMILSSLGLSDGFEIEATVWRCFMDKVQEFMTRHNNPYHNYYHISDVAQTCFVFVSELGAFELLRSHDILALVVGAIIHDLDHTGTNNLYHVNAKTNLAIQYNDISVLENHHCALAFKTANQPKCNIFSSLDNATYKIVRKTMISIVLATDMTCHFSLKSDVDDLVGRKFMDDMALDSRGCASTVSADNKEDTIEKVSLEDKDRETLLKAILHTADISNPAKCWKVSKKWSDLVVEEFFSQGDREKREGLPVSPNMDRNTTRQDELSVNFTDFIVAPFFLALTHIFPKLINAVTHLKTNRDEWHSMVVQRLQLSEDAGSVAVEESIAKWEKRREGFADTVDPVVAKAQSKLRG
eukprot:CAMPEP_0185039174 /NCGR_PEP_ID=MMETSP1103-20130426/35751_1 /TAXON_ID=36769 /ORGANISM="Paraphysomonas bandaiensis, Strain Caron Lab Isolate" /LENGTH=2231 /DNA_ID=CAMNT_0027577957 /DNA_START=219 /DNA_END=6917 /DNA_ORIENTATION=+